MDPPAVNGQIQPKFNNHQLGNGNGAESTIFDVESKDNRNAAYKQMFKNNRGDSVERQNNADVLVENEMLRAEVQKLKEKIKEMQQVSFPLH